MGFPQDRLLETTTFIDNKLCFRRYVEEPRTMYGYRVKLTFADNTDMENITTKSFSFAEKDGIPPLGWLTVYGRRYESGTSEYTWKKNKDAMTVWMVNKPFRFREIVKIKDNQIFCNGEDDRLSLVSAYVYNKDANFLNPETKKSVPFEEVIKAAKPGMGIVPCNHFCNKLKLMEQMTKGYEAEHIHPELIMCYDGVNKCGLDKFGLVDKAR